MQVNEVYVLTQRERMENQVESETVVQQTPTKKIPELPMNWSRRWVFKASGTYQYRCISAVGLLLTFNPIASRHVCRCWRAQWCCCCVVGWMVRWALAVHFGGHWELFGLRGYIGGNGFRAKGNAEWNAAGLLNEARAVSTKWDNRPPPLFFCHVIIRLRSPLLHVQLVQ